VTARVRKFAVAGLVAVLALGGGLLFLSRGPSSTPAAVPSIKPLHPVKKHQVHATTAAKVTKKAATKTALKTPKKTAKKTVVKAAPKAKAVAPKPAPAKPKRKRSVPAVINGMPGVLALALRSHRIVVASLYAPDSAVDKMAVDEARAGAAAAGAGFVALDVSNEKIVAPLTSLLTGAATAADRVLDDPAVLVFQAPGTLFVRLSGWTDRDTVAQAALNAAGAQ
jgi:hypothetical protein